MLSREGLIVSCVYYIIRLLPLYVNNLICRYLIFRFWHVRVATHWTCGCKLVIQKRGCRYRLCTIVWKIVIQMSVRSHVQYYKWNLLLQNILFHTGISERFIYIANLVVDMWCIIMLMSLIQEVLYQMSEDMQKTWHLTYNFICNYFGNVF